MFLNGAYSLYGIGIVLMLASTAGIACRYARPEEEAKIKVRRQRAGRSGLNKQALKEFWCPRRDSNPHTLRHMDLNHARLPIPPRGLTKNEDYIPNLLEVNSRIEQRSQLRYTLVQIR